MGAKTSEIKVRRHEREPGFYLAYYQSPILKATYTVEFPGSVLGAVALHHFTEMLKTRYPVGGVMRFVLPPDEMLQPVVREALTVEQSAHRRKEKRAPSSRPRTSCSGPGYLHP